MPIDQRRSGTVGDGTKKQERRVSVGSISNTVGRVARASSQKASAGVPAANGTAVVGAGIGGGPWLGSPKDTEAVRVRRPCQSRTRKTLSLPAHTVMASLRGRYRSGIRRRDQACLPQGSVFCLYDIIQARQAAAERD